MPDAVLRAAGPPERRPSVAVLEKAVAGRPARALERPPVRDRIFSGELRSVTGAVINHGPAQGDRSEKQRTAHRPLSRPPAGEKPWLKDPATAQKPAHETDPERRQPIHVKVDAPKPWLRAPEQTDAAATSATNAGKAPPEIVIIEAGDLDASTADVRGSENIEQWLVVDESITGAVVIEPAAEPVENRERPPEQPAESPPRTDAPVEKSPLIVVEQPASAPAPTAAASTAPAQAAPVVPPTLDSPKPVAPAPVALEIVVYADPEPLYGAAYPEPFIQLPDFPESPVVFDVPQADLPEEIVLVPATPEPERIADVPQAAMDALLGRLAAADDRYVDGIIFEYEYEYVEEDGAAPVAAIVEDVTQVEAVSVAPVIADVPAVPIADPLSEPQSEPVQREVSESPQTPAAKPVPRPAVPITQPVLRPAPEFVPDRGLDDDALDFIDTTDADAIKEELFAEISRDHDPGMDLDLALDLDSSIHEEIHGLAHDNADRARAAVYTPTAAEEIVDEISAEISSEMWAEAMAGDEFRLPTEPSSKDTITETYQANATTVGALDEGELGGVLLDDEELADHLLELPEPLESTSGDSHGGAESAQPGIAVLTPAERDALRSRLDRFWHETPAPTAATGADLLETLRRLYTLPQPEAHHFDSLLAYIQEHSRANALAVLMLDSAQMVYRPLLMRGFDGRTAANFYLGMDDAFLEYAPDFQILRAADFSDAHHFHKRFSSEFIHRIEGISHVSLRPYGAPGYLALVYEDLNHLTGHVLQSTLPPILTDALPPMLRLTREQWEAGHRPVTDESDEKFYEDTSIVDQIYRLLKEVSRGGRDSIEVVHLHFPNLLQQPNWLTQLDALAAKLLGRLGASEKMIQATPERITLILKETPASALLEIARAAASAAELTIRDQVMVYPDHSRNFYNYIAPGF